MILALALIAFCSLTHVRYRCILYAYSTRPLFGGKRERRILPHDLFTPRSDFRLHNPWRHRHFAEAPLLPTAYAWQMLAILSMRFKIVQVCRSLMLNPSETIGKHAAPPTQHDPILTSGTSGVISAASTHLDPHDAEGPNSIKFFSLAMEK